MGGAMFTTNELVFTFGGFYVCANFVENPSRNASVKVHSDGYTDVANWFYYIICPYYML